MKKIILLFLLFAIGKTAYLQPYSGIINIPADYPTLQAAVDALETGGVDGPVMLELSGYVSNDRTVIPYIPVHLLDPAHRPSF